MLLSQLKDKYIGEAVGSKRKKKPIYRYHQVLQILMIILPHMGGLLKGFVVVFLLRDFLKPVGNLWGPCAICL